MTMRESTHESASLLVPPIITVSPPPSSPGVAVDMDNTHSGKPIGNGNSAATANIQPNDPGDVVKVKKERSSTSKHDHSSFFKRFSLHSTKDPDAQNELERNRRLVAKVCTRVIFCDIL